MTGVRKGQLIEPFQEPRLVYVWEGEIEKLHAEIERLLNMLEQAAGRLTWCATARPGCESEEGRELAAKWAEEIRAEK